LQGHYIITARALYSFILNEPHDFIFKRILCIWVKMDIHLKACVPDPAGEGEASAFSFDDVSYLSCACGAYKTMMYS